MEPRIFTEYRKVLKTIIIEDKTIIKFKAKPKFNHKPNTKAWKKQFKL